MQMPEELQEKIRSARKDFDQMLSGESANHYLAQLQEGLSWISTHHLGAQGGIMTPGPSSSWEAVAELRKDADLKINQLQSEATRVEEFLRQ